MCDAYFILAGCKNIKQVLTSYMALKIRAWVYEAHAKLTLILLVYICI